MFVGKAWSILKSETHEMCFAWEGSGPTLEHYAWLEGLARDKHAFLFIKFLNYRRKKFYDIRFWTVNVFTHIKNS